jgi:hypothetical protein
VAFAFIWPPYFSVPSHYQWWLLSFTIAPLVILVPLLLSVPESPRWLEAKSRTAEALKILEMFERRATKRSKEPLPPPDLSTHKVTPTGKGHDRAAWAAMPGQAGAPTCQSRSVDGSMRPRTADLSVPSLARPRFWQCPSGGFCAGLVGGGGEKEPARSCPRRILSSARIAWVAVSPVTGPGRR